MKRFFLVALVIQMSMLFSLQEFTFVDFDQSMQTNNYSWQLEKNINREVLLFFKLLFNKHKQNSYEDLFCRIPKIIHQIWLGSSFPQEYKLCQESWIKNNPGWEFKLWTEKDIEDFAWQNRDLFDAAKNYGEKSDIWRYEILEQFGGLYIDVDMECLKSHEEIHSLFDFYIGIQPLDTVCVQLGIGIIGSIPHHPLLQESIKALPKSSKHTAIVARTGPLFFTNLFLKHAGRFGLRDIALPASYFYPCFYEQKGMSSSEWLKSESLAVHHWAATWLKKEAFQKD